MTPPVGTMRWFLVTIFGAGLLIGTACDRAPGRTAAEGPERAGADVLAGVRTAWVAAYNAGDAEALAAHFADEALLLPPGEPALAGRLAVERYLRQMLAGEAGTLDVVMHDVRESGGLAVDRAAYAVRGEDGAVRRGKYVMVWQRNAAGAWKIVWDMWNSDE